jgi:hypothetical protein
LTRSYAGLGGKLVAPSAAPGSGFSNAADTTGPVRRTSPTAPR